MSMAQRLPAGTRQQFNDTLNDVVLNRMSPNGSMLGDFYKSADSELGVISTTVVYLAAVIG
ncbi:MAG TPA: hypothetical protein VFE23_05435 [Usitatibacter sp.]|jgi:hypothetical protein|nr:hypothetical protein [Usitatibacter sp.]